MATTTMCQAFIGRVFVRGACQSVRCGQPAAYIRRSDGREGYCEGHGDRRHYAADWKFVSLWKSS